MNTFTIISFLSCISMLTALSMDRQPEETTGRLQKKLSGVIHRISSKKTHQRAKSDSNISSSIIDPRKELAKDYVRLAKDAIQERDESQFNELIQKISDLELKEQLMQQWHTVTLPAQSSDGSFLLKSALDAINKQDSVKYRWTKDRIINPQDAAQLQQLWDEEKKYIPEAQAAIRTDNEIAFKAALEHITDKKMKSRLERRWNLRHDKNVITSNRLSASKGSVTIHRQNPT